MGWETSGKKACTKGPGSPGDAEEGSEARKTSLSVGNLK